MGGCSSKPQTAECNEGLLDHPPPLNLLFHTSDSSPPHGSQHTLKSLFNQHGRDGEDLLGNAQTLHELLLHAVDSKELPDSENQSTGNTEANLQLSFPCKQNSPVSVISNAAENNASTCTKIEGSLPDLAETNEEAGAQLVSNLQVTEENAEKCTKSEGFTSNSAEGNQEKGAAHLEGFLPGLAEVTEGKGEAMLPALPEENAQDCIKAAGSFLSNVAEENQGNAGNLEGFVSNLAEGKLEEECPKLKNFAEENARKLEPQSSPGSVDLELKTEQISESNSSECVECNLGPKSDFFKISEPNLLESLTSDVIQASDAMEDKEAELQGLHGVAVNNEIKREVQGEIAMEATKAPKQDEEAMTYDKNEKSLQGKQTEDHRGKAVMEGVEIEKAMEGKKTELHCEKTLEIEKNEISQEGEKAEVWNEKAMEAEVQFEDNNLREKMEKAMECEKVGMQDEKGRKTGAQYENSTGEDEKTGVQSERVFNREVDKTQRDEEDEKAVRVEKPESIQEAEKKESQDEKNTGVQDEKTRVQGERDEETEVQHEERAEDEKAIANVSSLHVNVEDEEAIADVPSSHVNQSFAFTLEKHSSFFEPLTGSEKSIAIGSGPVLELASKENTIEAAELGLIEKLNESDEKKFAFKDSTIAVVADLGLTEKLEADLTKLASDGNTIEAVGLADVEKMDFEQKKTRKTEQVESHKSSIEAVAGGTHAKLGNIVKALDDEQSKSTDLEQMLCIERHGKIDHDILGAFQHSEADNLDEEKNAKAPGLEESYIEAVIGSSKSSNQVVGEKRDALELCTNEEKKAPKALVEQSLHEGNAREESSNPQNPSQLVVESDSSDVNVKVDVSSKAQVFVQKDHDAEKLACGHIQMPINELDLITSKGVESHTQACKSPSCSTPESSVHENLPCPTVVERDAEKRVADINSSSLSAAENSFIEGVESKPRPKTSGEAIDDGNGKTHMEASKQCDEKGEGLKATEELENLEICD